DVWRLDEAAPWLHRGEPDVVENDVQDVWRSLRRNWLEIWLPIRRRVARVKLDRALEFPGHPVPPVSGKVAGADAREATTGSADFPRRPWFASGDTARRRIPAAPNAGLLIRHTVVRWRVTRHPPVG